VIAIAALAKQIHLSTGTGYFSGLWHDRLYMGLLWVAKGANERLKEAVAPSWSWAAVSGSIVYPKFFTSAQTSTTVLTPRVEVVYLTDVPPAIASDGDEELSLSLPEWLNGPAFLTLRGQVKMTLISGTPTEGLDGQHVPLAVTDENGCEPLADVAGRLGIEEVDMEADANALHEAGVSTVAFSDFVEVKADRTRDIIDESKNKIGWAVLDEDDGFVITGTDGDLDMIFFMALYCVRIASHIDDRGIERNFVLFLQPVELEANVWQRLGMGLILGKRYFEGAEETVVTIL
jgi:hypothetical protein